MKIAVLLLILVGILCDSGNPDLEADWSEDKCIIQGECANNGTKSCEIYFDVTSGISDGSEGDYSRVIVTRNGDHDTMREYEIEYQCFEDPPYDQWIINEKFYPGEEVTCYHDTNGDSKTVFRDPRPAQKAYLTEVLLWSILTPCFVFLPVTCILLIILIIIVMVIIVIIIVIIIMAVIICMSPFFMIALLFLAIFVICGIILLICALIPCCICALITLCIMSEEDEKQSQHPRSVIRISSGSTIRTQLRREISEDRDNDRDSDSDTSDSDSSKSSSIAVEIISNKSSIITNLERESTEESGSWSAE